jgi:thiol:disulfide interchange protein DsbC
MKKFKLSTLVVLFFLSSFAFGETKEEEIKRAITPRLAIGAQVDSVVKTPYSGLYEIRVGKDLMYTDEEAKYLFVGRILDTRTRQDYTKARTQELNKINFSDLPLVSAMKVVKGNGKRVLAIFSDPNCGYCKKLEKVLQSVDNVTVYTFMYNMLSSDSLVKAKNIWCSADRTKAWEDWMSNGRLASVNVDGCSFPQQQVVDFGKKWKISGTPTLFLADGTRIPNTLDVQTLEAHLKQVEEQ